MQYHVVLNRVIMALDYYDIPLTVYMPLFMSLLHLHHMHSCLPKCLMIACHLCHGLLPITPQVIVCVLDGTMNASVWNRNWKQLVHWSDSPEKSLGLMMSQISPQWYDIWINKCILNGVKQILAHTYITQTLLVVIISCYWQFTHYFLFQNTLLVQSH